MKKEESIFDNWTVNDPRLAKRLKQIQSPKYTPGIFSVIMINFIEQCIKDARKHKMRNPLKQAAYIVGRLEGRMGSFDF